MTKSVMVQSTTHHSTFTLTDFQRHLCQFLHCNDTEICPQFHELLTAINNGFDNFTIQLNHFDSRKIYLAYCRGCCLAICENNPCNLLLEPLRDLEITNAMMAHIIATCISKSILTIIIS